jgi:hypothetical protein
MKSKYQGFGPTLAHEKLWKARKAKKVMVHQLRER